MKYKVILSIFLVIAIVSMTACSSDSNFKKAEEVLYEVCNKYNYKIDELQSSKSMKVYQILGLESNTKTKFIIYQSPNELLEGEILLEKTNRQIESSNTVFKEEYDFLINCINYFTNENYKSNFIESFIESDLHNQSLSKKDSRIIEKMMNDKLVNLSYSVVTATGTSSSNYQKGDEITHLLSITFEINL